METVPFDDTESGAEAPRGAKKKVKEPLADIRTTATSSAAPRGGRAPESRGFQKAAILLLALAGISLLVILLVRQGSGDVLKAVATARWGLLLIAAYHAIPLFLDALQWWMIISRDSRPPLRAVWLLRWIGESVSNLVPASSLGGDILRARLLRTTFGVPLNAASASVIVHITLGLLGQIVFTLAGLLALVWTVGRTNLTVPCAIGIGIALLSVGGFYGVQKYGIFRLLQEMAAKLMSEGFIHSLLAKGDRLDAALRHVYADHRAIAGSFILSIVYWMAGSVEVWIALKAIGAPASFGSALIFEGVGQGIRSVLFFIPGALGVQEGGYILVGGLIGVSGEVALAISLIRRVRELIIGIPGLILWQILEGARLWKKSVAGLSE